MEIQFQQFFVDFLFVFFLINAYSRPSYPRESNPVVTPPSLREKTNVPFGLATFTGNLFDIIYSFIPAEGQSIYQLASFIH